MGRFRYSGCYGAEDAGTTLDALTDLLSFIRPYQLCVKSA